LATVKIKRLRRGDTVGKCSHQTGIGGFEITAINVVEGKIAVMTDGPALHRKIGLLASVADGDNRFTGITRAPGQNFILHVAEDHREVGEMKRLFSAFIAEVVELLPSQVEQVGWITADVSVPEPAVVIDALYAREH
jgi:hypothetical protein